MNWMRSTQRYWNRMRNAQDSGVEAASITAPGADEVRDPAPLRVERTTRAILSDGKRDRVRTWRRRVLLKRGALMHTGMNADAGDRSFAMLDEDGIVISWYGSAAKGRCDPVGDGIVDRHVSQFYVPQDIASQQPLRDLHVAAVDGTATREGWRRCPDGIVFWGSTVIQALLLRDGRVQGFSYVTRACDGPSAHVPIAGSLDDPRRVANEDSPEDSPRTPQRMAAVPVWDAVQRNS